MNAIRFRPPVAPQLGHIFLRDGPEGLLGAFSDDFFLLFLLGWIAPAGQNPLGFVARLPGVRQRNCGVRSLTAKSFCFPLKR
jgi:hypothetical protein